MPIEIIDPGMFTTIQDLGRRGYQKYGIPPSGAIDSYSAKLANLLVGNRKEEACLEATVSAPTLGFKEKSWVAVTGLGWKPKLNGKELPLWESFPVARGDKLSIDSTGRGMRVYIAFSGGIDVHQVLGSKSTYARANLGGFKGRALQKGDELKIPSPEKVVPQSIPEPFRTDINFEDIGVILGPQDEKFTEEGIENLLTSKYEVQADSDRMGIRLDGPPIDHHGGADIISEPVAGGSIQVPGNGKPIILLADRQTTGGYTKVATVVKAEGPSLAQMRPGQEVSFREVSLERAYELREELRRNLSEVETKLKEEKLTSVRDLDVSMGDENYSVGVKLKSAEKLETTVGEETFTISLVKTRRSKETTESSEKESSVPAPMPGEILSIQVSKGDEISEGAKLLTIEAMKMENTITAPFRGVVSRINVSVGDQVKDGEELLKIAR